MSLAIIKSELHNSTGFSLKFTTLPSTAVVSKYHFCIYFSPWNYFSEKPQSQSDWKLPKSFLALEFSIFRSKHFMPVSNFLKCICSSYAQLPFKDSPWLTSLMKLSACQENNTNAEVTQEPSSPLCQWSGIAANGQLPMWTNHHSFYQQQRKLAFSVFKQWR